MNNEKKEKQVSILPNKVIVATDFIPHASSVSIGLWLPTGSSLETLKNNGVSHFYEHLVFKGTKSYSAFQIAREIEDLGGSLNAYTSRDVTCFYIHIAKEHLQTAIKVLASLITEPKLSSADFEKEKNVILEEIRSVEDDPEELSDDFFYEKHFKGCALEFPIAGSLSSVQNLNLSEIHKHQKYILESLPILISVAGAVEHNKLLKNCEKLFSYKKTSGDLPRISYSTNSGTHILQKHVQQATVLWGMSFENLNSKELRALQIFNHIFGSGFTSRLFQNIREKYGLVYSISSSLDSSIHKTNAEKSFAVFQISFAAEMQNLECIIDLIRKEVGLFLKKGFLKQELERAKQGIIGSYKLSIDSISSRQNTLARQILKYSHPIDEKKAINEIKKMEERYIENFIKENIQNSNWTLAAIVPKLPKKSPISGQMHLIF